MKGAFRIGRIAGIGIFIHWTFLILILFVVISNYRQGHDAMQIAWSVAFVLSIFVTVLLHEMGHALTARRYNIKTKDITLLPIGGLARLEKMPEKPSEELVVAFAGPAVNVALALITGLVIDFPDASEMSDFMSGGVNAANFLFNFFVVNLWLAIFNLIPAFPMDGGRVLRAILSMKLERHVATRIAARIGQALAVGFVLAGFFSNPFLVVIGIFIFLGAQAESEYTRAQSFLRGFRVGDAIMRQYQSIEAGETLKTATSMLLNGQYRNFLVIENGVPVGTLSRDELIKGLAEAGDGAMVGGVMNRNLVSLEANVPLETAYQRGREQKADLMLVTENGKFAGTLDTENILEFIMVRAALARQAT
jgi:Zn-dependent protease